MPREGHDSYRDTITTEILDFNPRAPRGARHIAIPSSRQNILYFNPRAPRGARLLQTENWKSIMTISIHVPREGHDFLRGLLHLHLFISIHVPREGHDPNFGQYQHPPKYFNPRAPRGARQQLAYNLFVKALISIHVPREGHDDITSAGLRCWHNFNPRAPRGARPSQLRALRRT